MLEPNVDGDERSNVAHAATSSRPPLSENSELLQLPAAVRHRLSQLLARPSSWHALLEAIPRCRDDLIASVSSNNHQATRLFSPDHVELVEAESVRSSRSPVDLIIDEWSTWGRRGQRPRVSDLVTLLAELSLFRAADYLRCHVLHMDKFPRPTVCGDQHIEGAVSDNSHTAAASAQYDIISTCINNDDASSLLHFPLDYLAQVTDNFNEASVSAGGRQLGAGAFGCVFLAHCGDCDALPPQLAVKRLIVDNNAANADNHDAQLRQFRTEVEVMCSYTHVNLLRLLGFSCDGVARCLVYEYMSNGSLLDRLACLNDSVPLSGATRLHVVEGAAQALTYLHTGQLDGQAVVHRDVKSANILLDHNFNAKVGDFGLSRFLSAGDRSATSTALQLTAAVIGTSAYMPPEAFRGDISVKLDTFSFGVVLLEVLTGLEPYDETREGFDLLSHVLDYLDESDERGAAATIVDKRAKFAADVADSLLEIALACTEQKRSRPHMSHVLARLQKLHVS